MKEPANKEYLGDGAYVWLDDYGALVLTTEDGLTVTNTIILEPAVYTALLEYIQRPRKGVRTKDLSPSGPFM